jgi:hypothetical protein
MLNAVLIRSGFYCPYCLKFNGVNEGSSEAFDNGDVLITCGYCNKEAISDRIE